MRTAWIREELHLCSFDGKNNSPNITPAIFFFPNLKEWFAVKRFSTEQIIGKTNAYFEAQLKNLFFNGLQKS